MKIQLSNHFNFHTLFRFTLPSVVMMIVTSIYSVVDGLFVSNLVGDNALAALNIIFPLTMMVGAFGFMLGAGGSAEVARVMGMGEPDKAKQYFTTLILTVVAGGALLSGLCIIFIRPLSILLGASEVLLEDCVAYGVVMLSGSVPFMLQTSFQSFLVAAERPKMGLILSLLAGVTNMILDYLFIAVLGWGIAGAGLATVCGYLVGGVVPLVYFLLPNKSTLRLVKTRLYPRMLLKSCANGSSELMTNVSSSAVTVLYNHQLMALAGEAGVAALSVMMYINFIFSAAFIGFSMGAAPIFSYQYGAGNETELKSLYRKCRTVIGVLSLAMAVSAQLFVGPLANVFVGYNPALRAMTVEGFRIFALCFLFSGLNIFGSSFFTALGDGAASAAISFLRTLVFQCGAILLLPVFFGLTGVWAAVVVAESLALIVTALFLHFRKKRYRYA